MIKLLLQEVSKASQGATLPRNSMGFEDTTSAFLAISTPSVGLSETTCATLERFVMLMHYKDSESMSIDKTCKALDTSKDKAVE